MYIKGLPPVLRAFTLLWQLFGGFQLDCLAMRSLLFIWLSAVAVTAQAQVQDWELGARYWLSTGMTERSHNAQGVAPALGNPTSVLTYESLDAHALELHARKGFGKRWFVRGNAGLGWIRNGSFQDEDIPRRADEIFGFDFHG
jgi:hypothetical protein